MSNLVILLWLNGRGISIQVITRHMSAVIHTWAPVLKYKLQNIHMGLHGFYWLILGIYSFWLRSPNWDGMFTWLYNIKYVTLKGMENCLGPFHWYGFVFTCQGQCGMKLLILPKLNLLQRWSLGMDTYIHPTIYNGCDYSFTMVFQLIHVSKVASGAKPQQT